MDSKYKVVFTGRLRAGFGLEDVVANLAAITNMDEEKAGKFVASGRPTVVKKGVEREAADILAARLDKAGLEMRVVRLENEPAGPVTPPPPPPPVSPRAETLETPAASLSEVPDNPYASPKANLKVEDRGGAWLDAPQKVGAAHGWEWIKSALAMFFSEPWKWMAMVFVSGLLTVLLSLIPIVGSFASMVLGAVLAGGLMMAARDQEQGGALAVATLFRGFSHNRNQLLLVGTYYLCVWIIFGLIFGVMIGVGALSIFGFGADSQAMAGAVQQNVSMFFVLVLALMALSIPVMMAYWFATPLVALADLTAWNAYKQSFAACMKNWLPFLVYGLVFLALGILAMVGFSAITGLLALFFSGSEYGFLTFIPAVAVMMLMGVPFMAIVGLSLYTGFTDIFQRSA